MADLYSLQGQEPEPLPEKVRLPDSGLTRTTKDITPELLAFAGWSGPYERPTDFDERTHRCVWSPDDMAYTVVERSSIDLRNARNSAIAQMRLERDDLLNLSDRRIMPWLEKSLPAPEAWQRYRQALRDLPQSTEDPFQILWPREPMPHEIEEAAPAPEAPKPRAPRRRKTT